METTAPLVLNCPAKVNLALSIGAPLANGYHPLASWMVAVRFADRLSLWRSLDGQSRFELSFAPEALAPAKVDWPLEKDLAYRAHQLLERHTGRTLPVRLSLRKLIPTGAGLGGGSSDAAAVLVGLDKLFSLRLGEPTLMQLGQRLGSDVGFLVGAIASGKTSAIVTGLGEQIDAVPLAQTLHLVLIFPPFGCPTGEVYRAFDHLRRFSDQPGPDESRVRSLALQAPLPPEAPFNDLAEPAWTVRPDLLNLLEKIQDLLRICIHVTGSGSTLFLIAPDAAAAQALARQVTATAGLPAMATQTI